MNGSLTRTTSIHSAAHASATGVQLPGSKSSKPLPGRLAPPSSPSLNGAVDQKTSVHSGSQSSKPELPKAKGGDVKCSCPVSACKCAGRGAEEKSLTTTGGGKGSTGGGKHECQQLTGGAPPLPMSSGIRNFTPEMTALRNALLGETVIDDFGTHKAFYNYITPAALTTAGTAYLLNQIPLAGANPTIGTRLGNSIKIRRLQGRLEIAWIPSTTASTTALAVPYVRVFIFQEKVVSSPGTPVPAIIQGSATPDGSTYTPYTALSVALNTAYVNGRALRDPFSHKEFAVYYDELVHPRPEFQVQYSNFAGPLGSWSEHRVWRDIDVKLDFVNQFDNTTNNPQTGALQLNFNLDEAPGTAGGTVFGFFHYRIVFDDDMGISN